METKQTSQFLSLDWNDLGKGLIVATLTPILLIIQESLNAGAFTIDYKHIGMAAVAGGVGYLIKNLFTPTKEVVKNEPTR